MLLLWMSGLLLMAYLVAAVVARGHRAAYERRRLEELSEVPESSDPFDQLEITGRFDR